MQPDETDLVLINLNGIKTIHVSRKLLTSVPDTSLEAMFSGRHSLQETDEVITIERNPEPFEYLIQYLENGKQLPDSEDQDKR